MNKLEKKFVEMLRSDSVSGYHAQDVAARFYESYLDERNSWLDKFEKLAVMNKELVSSNTRLIEDVKSLSNELALNNDVH